MGSHVPVAHGAPLARGRSCRGEWYRSLRKISDRLLWNLSLSDTPGAGADAEAATERKALQGRRAARTSCVLKSMIGDYGGGDGVRMKAKQTRAAAAAAGSSKSSVLVLVAMLLVRLTVGDLSLQGVLQSEESSMRGRGMQSCRDVQTGRPACHSLSWTRWDGIPEMILCVYSMLEESCMFVSACGEKQRSGASV